MKFVSFSRPVVTLFETKCCSSRLPLQNPCCSSWLAVLKHFSMQLIRFPGRHPDGSIEIASYNGNSSTLTTCNQQRVEHMVNFLHIFLVMPSGSKIATKHAKCFPQQCEMQSSNTIGIRMEIAIIKQFTQGRGCADPDALMMAVSTQKDPPTCGRDVHLFTFAHAKFPISSLCHTRIGSILQKSPENVLYFGCLANF